MYQPGFFDVPEHLKRLSEAGDPLEAMDAAIDFEAFRPVLAAALGYIARHWKGLQVFLTDSRVEIDSNAVENTVRPLALNRKNALFAGHSEGGRNWGRIALLIETAKLNGIDPHAYLKATLQAIAHDHPASRIDDLLPWNFRTSS